MELKYIILFLLSTTSFLENSTAARDLPIEQGSFATLESDGGLVDCWNALAEIKTCSNEIIVYFVSGTTNISPPCCKAISMITHHCWHSMLTALGFTTDEDNVLRGYCDGSSAPAAAATPPVQPPVDLMGDVLV
ncbi:Egg cell-secreted protein 1.4 [Camellia lanceoleosa]|uniref:Egg cell-secreted protein 1.4 n=1 Tax=Camellia lanceoleosa TaxID=1840588 RepID=A0ACC0G1F9_9ERIC|nr:Egg cell-secreted protein 1.4 [Camellia lanceoleosa]